MYVGMTKVFLDFAVLQRVKSVYVIKIVIIINPNPELITSTTCTRSCVVHELMYNNKHDCTYRIMDCF